SMAGRRRSPGRCPAAGCRRRSRSRPPTAIGRWATRRALAYSRTGAAEVAEPARPLPLSLQVSYGLGSAALGAGGIALSATLLQLFFNQVIGLPAIWVGTAIMATVVIDSITDPLIGLFSDRLRSPLGRRPTLMYPSA